jgi:hypothetical protein
MTDDGMAGTGPEVKGGSRKQFDVEWIPVRQWDPKARVVLDDLEQISRVLRLMLPLDTDAEADAVRLLRSAQAARRAELAAYILQMHGITEDSPAALPLPASPRKQGGGAVALSYWDSDPVCHICHQPGGEMVYSAHPACLREKSASRRAAPAVPAELLESVRSALGGPGRLIISAAQLRALLTLVCASPGFDPVRRPDAGQKPPWYARVPGWSAGRMAGELTAQQAAGFYLDCLEHTGRMPPVRRRDVLSLLAVLGDPAAVPQTVPSAGKEQETHAGEH